MSAVQSVLRPFHETVASSLDKLLPYLQRAGHPVETSIRILLALIDDTELPSSALSSITGVCQRVANQAAFVGQEDIADMATTAIRKLQARSEEATPTICDGCDVFNGWEHKCHGKNAVVRGERTNKPCECRPCAFAHLPTEEQEKLACANYLDIDPKHISDVKTTYDGGGHFTGINAVIHVSTGRGLAAWVRDNLPKPRSEEE